MGVCALTCATTGTVTDMEYTFGYERNSDGKALVFIHHTSVPHPVASTPAPVTEAQVRELQSKWASAIASCSTAYAKNGDYVKAASDALDLYGYGHTEVRFKPTKATKHPFRATREDAWPYFVDAEATNNSKFAGEDVGFAINDGNCWKQVLFNNHKIELKGQTAIAMGSYDLTCATTGTVAIVDYTFGYERHNDGKTLVVLHHASMPYAAAPAADAPNTEAEVRELQGKRANAIVSCSATYARDGDYVKAVSDAAVDLYSYGHTGALVKPTAATKNPFRPTGEDAASYFVGAEAMNNIKSEGEDFGFAINGGKGWNNFTFKNHKIELKGRLAFAMGSVSSKVAWCGLPNCGLMAQPVFALPSMAPATLQFF